MRLLLSHSPDKYEQCLLTALWQIDQHLMNWQKFIIHIKDSEEDFREGYCHFLIGEGTEVLGSK